MSNKSLNTYHIDYEVIGKTFVSFLLQKLSVEEINAFMRIINEEDSVKSFWQESISELVLITSLSNSENLTNIVNDNKKHILEYERVINSSEAHKIILTGSVEYAYKIYLEIKNKNFKIAKKRSIEDILNSSDSEYTALKILSKNKIIKKNIFGNYKVIKDITIEDIIKIVNKEYEQRILNINRVLEKFEEKKKSYD